MKIKHVIIENFRAIKKLDFECSGKVNVFIGDNGVGKTTVLEAIFVLCSWLNAKLSLPKGKGRSIRNEDIRIGAEYCFLSIAVEYKGKSAQWSLMRGISSDNSSEKQTDLRELETLVRYIREFNDDGKSLFSIYVVTDEKNAAERQRKAIEVDLDEGIRYRGGYYWHEPSEKSLFSMAFDGKPDIEDVKKRVELLLSRIEKLANRDKTIEH